MIRDVHPGSGSRIPGVIKVPDPGSASLRSPKLLSFRRSEDPSVQPDRDVGGERGGQLQSPHQGPAQLQPTQWQVVLPPETWRYKTIFFQKD
jgi:hypothetical protein